VIALRTHRAALGVGAALLLLTVLAWVLTVYQTAQMGAMSGMGGPMTPAISSASPLTDLAGALTLAVFLPMWTTMMAAMMLPSVTPMVLLFDRVSRSKAGNVSPVLKTLPTALFVAGYLLVWTAFGLLAFAVGAALGVLGGYLPALAAHRSIVVGVLLAGAGLYQFTPLKRACLKHCRSPLDYLAHHWHTGRGAAVQLGLHHGLYCIGCCWGLMLVLCAVGLMSLPWMGLVALVILMEKVLPRERWLCWAIAALLLLAGALAAIGHLPGVMA
jgi:predicted metal-binding membrane protein